MTLVFSLVAAALAAVALYLVVPVILRAPDESGTERKHKNIEVARQRLADLEERRSSGQIDSTDADILQEEIERGLLHDVEQVHSTSASGQEFQAGEPKVAAWSAAAVAALTPATAVVLYLVLGSPQLISVTAQQSPKSASVTEKFEQGENLSPAERQILLHSERLKTDSGNAQLWEELGLLHLEAGNISEAVAAFRKIREVSDNTVSSFLLEAQALSFSDNSQLQSQAHALVMQTLQVAPDNPTALIMAGILTAQRGEYQSALNYWERALPLLPSQEREQITALLADAKSRMENTLSAETGEGPGAVIANVSVAPALAEQIDPQDTVFVFAHATTGPRMPLAVVKKQVQDLPAQVILSDAMAMVPNMKLSSFDEVTVVARVSKSGTAQAGSGDLFGQSEAFRPADESAVGVVISQVIP